MKKKKDAEDILEWFMRLPVVVHIFFAALALWLLSFTVLKSLDVYTRHNQSIIVPDRKSTRLNSSHTTISYAVFCLKKKKEILSFRMQGVEGPLLRDRKSVV